MEFLIIELLTVGAALLVIVLLLGKLSRKQFELMKERLALQASSEQIRYYQLEQERIRLQEQEFDRLFCDDLAD